MMLFDSEFAKRRDKDEIVRRAVELVVVLAALIFLLPLIVAIALVVLASDRGPIFFGHVRIGKDGRPFRCLKFRTMAVDADRRLLELLASDPDAKREWALSRKLQDDPRITVVGTFLRKSSLDELPQLFNVLKGEMSIVGPRPVIADEAKLYGRYFGHYTSVKPGITGLWQISGRNNVSYRRRVALDVAYTRSKSLNLDLQIILLTVPCVIFARGSY